MSESCDQCEDGEVGPPVGKTCHTCGRTCDKTGQSKCDDRCELAWDVPAQCRHGNPFMENFIKISSSEEGSESLVAISTTAMDERLEKVMTMTRCFIELRTTQCELKRNRKEDKLRCS